jgi:GAF domain-containing protein
MTPTVAEALARESTVSSLLKSLCRELCSALDADACNLSRVIGQLLIDLAEFSRDGRRIQLGRSYLVPDFPVTQAVIESLEHKTVWLMDPHVDPGEAALLRELDFDYLLMVPLVLEGRCWGLVELYRTGTNAFEPADAEAATAIVERAAELIETLQRRAAAA